MPWLQPPPSPKLAEAWGQQIVHENRSGAGGTIGAELALRAVPDGYTILFITASYTVNPSMHKLAFDPLNDITQAVIDLLGGQIQLMIAAGAGVMHHVRVQKLRGVKPD